MNQNQEHDKTSDLDAQDTTHDSQATIFEQELHKCRAQQDELKNKLMHVTADFDNYKKRIEKDRLALTTSAQTAIIADVLSIVNDFDRALAESQKQAVSEEQKAWLAGFELIKKSLYKLLNTYQVQEITQVTTFDPQLHEALMHVNSPEHKAGDIVQVLEKGFTMRGHVIRPAKVSVAQ